MSAEGPVELRLVPAQAPKGPSRADPLRDYISTLHNGAEIASLIVTLEELSRGSTRALGDPGLLELAAHGGLDLSRPEDIQTAVLALGARAERVGAAELGRAPRLERRDLPTLSDGLVQVMETARQSVTEPEQLAEDVTAATREALSLWQRNLPSREQEEAYWWVEVRKAVEARTIPGYLAAARRLNQIEQEPLRGLLFRSPLAMAVLCGMFGVMTFAFPVSTPFVILALALFGAFVLHPYYVRQVIEPLEALGENLSAEEPRIRRLAGEQPWRQEDFSLEGVLSDLLPVLEGERRAGRCSTEELRAAISAYFDAVGPAFEEAGRGGRYLTSLRKLLEGRLAREYARFSAARSMWEGHWIASVVDNPIISAVVVAIFTLPVSWIASRISPIPPTIDFPAMIAVFALFGHALPRLLVGTGPSREALIKRLAEEQSALESMP